MLFALRPLGRGASVAFVAFALVQLWIFSLAPSNTADWQPDVSQLASAKLDGDLLTIQNVRNFDWTSDSAGTPHWDTRTYDLSKLEGLDMFFSYWGSPSIAHTIMSWDFSGRTAPRDLDRDTQDGRPGVLDGRRLLPPVPALLRGRR